MLVAVLVASLLGQTPEYRAPVAVVVTSKRPGADPYAAKIAARVQDVLKREGTGSLMDDVSASKELKAAGFSDPRTCQGGQSCIAKLAVLLGARAVIVGVDVGKVGKALAIHLEAIASDVSEPLAATDITASADKWGDQAAVGITVFVRQLKDKLAIQKSPEKAKPTDAPKVATLEPPPREPPLVVATPPKTGSKTAAWVVGGGAIAAAGAGVALALLGSADKARYDAALVTTPDGLRGTTLTQADANALAGSANLKFTLALTSFIASAALGGTAAWLFVKE